MYSMPAPGPTDLQNIHFSFAKAKRLLVLTDAEDPTLSFSYRICSCLAPPAVCPCTCAVPCCKCRWLVKTNLADQSGPIKELFCVSACPAESLGRQQRKTLENMMAHAGHFDTLYDADGCLVADSHCQFSAGLLLGMFTQTSSIAFPSFIPVSPAFPLLGGNMVEMDNICCPCSNLKVLMLVRHQENSRTQSCNREWITAFFHQALYFEDRMECHTPKQQWSDLVTHSAQPGLVEVFLPKLKRTLSIIWTAAACAVRFLSMLYKCSGLIFKCVTMCPHVLAKKLALHAAHAARLF